MKPHVDVGRVLVAEPRIYLVMRVKWRKWRRVSLDGQAVWWKRSVVVVVRARDMT